MRKKERKKERERERRSVRERGNAEKFGKRKRKVSVA
jgi:hypothetical protein